MKVMLFIGGGYRYAGNGINLNTDEANTDLQMMRPRMGSSGSVEV